MDLLAPCDKYIRNQSAPNRHLPDMCLNCTHVEDDEPCSELARRINPPLVDQASTVGQAKGNVNATLS